MREIKFRGIDVKTGEWIYGPLLTWPDGKAMIYDTPLSDSSMGGKIINPDTIGQFTGLRDKNGKGIYEGDILKRGDVIHIVEYREDEGAFVGRFYPQSFVQKETMMQPLHTGLSQWWINKFEKEVIGNIHDNPELIK